MPHPASQRLSFTMLAPIAIVALALTLAGCGRRGSLEAPPGAPGAEATAQRSAPRLTPGVAGSAARQSAATRDPLSQASRGGEEEDEPPIPAPNRPFILDAIL